MTLFTAPIIETDAPEAPVSLPTLVTNFADIAYAVRHSGRRVVVVKPEPSYRLYRVRVRFLDWFLTWPWEPWVWMRSPRGHPPFWYAEHRRAVFTYPPGLVQTNSDCWIEGNTVLIAETIYRQAMDDLLTRALDHAGRSYRREDRLLEFGGSASE